jgi:hypothetical protein
MMSIMAQTLPGSPKFTQHMSVADTMQNTLYTTDGCNLRALITC